MTTLHNNYKDVFRALRLGFSAKKVWMMFMGLLVGFAGYAVLTYLAYVASGVDFLLVWEEFRLLPFPDQLVGDFTWYSWVVYALAVTFFAAASLIAGTAVAKVTYEQLRGDEFYESREAYRFAFRQWSSVLASPLLVIGFIVLLFGLGLLLSALGAIPVFGEIFVAILALPALGAAFFVVYLLIVLLFGLLMIPAIVGTTRNDTFDTIFEVFSCVNEQPARLVWYLAIVGFLSHAGTLLFGLATSAAGRIGYGVVQLFTGSKMADVMSNAGFYFRVSLPSWWPEPLRMCFLWSCNAAGLPQVYMPGEYLSLSWSNDVASLLLGVGLYVAALLVLAYGCSVWYSGSVMAYAVLAHKKDEKNILEAPEDDEDLLEPVVKPGDVKPACAPAESKPQL
jgi:hypothetical protein